MEELYICGKCKHANITLCEMCMRKDTLLDTAWQPVHTWPQLKKDEVIYLPSASLSVHVKCYLQAMWTQVQEQKY